MSAAGGTGSGRLPVTVVNVGALYRLLMVGVDVLPSSVSVHVANDDATIQLFAREIGDLPAIEAVWAVSGLLDQRDPPRAAVSESGSCHFEVRGRLGGLAVSVVTVLVRPAAAEAA